MKNIVFQTLSVVTSYQQLHNLKLLHLSDLHLNKKTSYKQWISIIQKCNDLTHDIVVLTGDIIDCHVKHIKPLIDVLHQLKKPVYVVCGNHDLVYGYQALKQLLPKFHFLDNGAQTIEFNQYCVQLVGISDRFSKFFKMPRDEQGVHKLLSYQPSILLAHQPKDYLLATQTQTALFVCGHTHGGQIFPFHYLVKLVQPFLSGLHYVKQTAIYVNKGLGTWGISLRYKAPAEITVLQLIAKSVE